MCDYLYIVSNSQCKMDVPKYMLNWILKNSQWIVLKNNILANQRFSGNSKGVNNRHMYFESMNNLGKAIMDAAPYDFPYKFVGKF